MGDKFLNVSGFRQMCGRAGRMGYDSVVGTRLAGRIGPVPGVVTDLSKLSILRREKRS